jgi:prepilin-type N-terminal cleavage/methylation domain-containing protein
MGSDDGFTLLELLLVIFILSILALGAVSLVETSDDQIRFDDTQSRLEQLRAGIVGTNGRTARLRGYVVDMGVLPGDIESLVRRGDADAFGAVLPEFGGSALDDHDAVKLLKGWRGSYVALPGSTDPDNVRFRDGWGTISLVGDALHHGWSDLDPTAEPFEITSYGADGGPGGTGDYDGDQTLRIVKDDWTVNLADWTVELRNASGGELELYVTVLFWENGTWKRADSGSATIADGTSETVAFGDETVPIGRHLALVVKKNGVGDVPYEDPDAGSGACPYVARKVSFLARNLPAPLTLEIP